jgi:hypothetical protein
VNNFEIVEGRIESVATRGGRIYLNFGSDWRRDFTVALRSRLVQSEPEKLQHLLSLKGTRIRVRGWIERRNGPLIDISDPNEIEFLGDGSEEEAAPAPLEPRGAEKERRPVDVQPGADR